ncbi:hypothetical protein [Streptomyces sp. NPDC007991]|uniref:hypothetical protein n=1 Tax=Streptomyces sp. NPDC007991 TaxID=3364803 RepID=UPI0036E7AAF8
MTDQPTPATLTEEQLADLAGRIKRTIGPTMLLGLQNAELHDEPGTERIREWVTWIAGAIAPLVTDEVNAQLERIRASVTEGKSIGRPRTASDVMVAHEVTRKALAHALDAGLHLNWPQLVDEAQRSRNANAAWKADVDRVRALHTLGKTNGCCNDCGMAWPCTTIQALDNKEPTT